MPKGEVNLILQFSVQCLPPSTVHYFQHCKISAGEHKNESTHGKRLIPAKGLPDQHFWTSLCRGCWLSMAIQESSGIEDSLRPWQSRRGNGVKHSAAHTVKHLLFTSNTFEFSHCPDSRQVIRISTKHWPWRERSWLKPDPGKKDVTANGSRNILNKQLRHHFCHKASFTSSIKQDYPASAFSASCPGLQVSLGILISPRTAFGFIHLYARQPCFYRCLAPLRKEWRLIFVAFFVQLVLKHLFQSPKWHHCQ